MASQQVNRSTTSQVVEAWECEALIQYNTIQLKILYEQEIATRATC